MSINVGVGVMDARAQDLLERLKYVSRHMGRNYLQKETLQAPYNGQSGPSWVRFKVSAHGQRVCVEWGNSGNGDTINSISSTRFEQCLFFL